jgi:hypothetical protein
MFYIQWYFADSRAGVPGSQRSPNGWRKAIYSSRRVQCNSGDFRGPVVKYLR